MSTDFPSKELLEVIRSQARMEEKLDAFLRNSASMQSKLSAIEKDVAELKAKRREDRAYIAALSAVFSLVFAFFSPILRKFLGF